MTDLRALTDKARSAQKYKPDNTETDFSAENVKSNPTAKNKKKPKPRKKASEGESANSKVLKLIGSPETPTLSPAERQAKRREEIARISFEVSIEEKTDLMKAAKSNGQSLTAEVRQRLGLQPKP